MTTDIFPTAQQLADMLLAINLYEGASSEAADEGNGLYFIGLTVERDGKHFDEGFWYEPAYAADGEFLWACRRITEISDAVAKWIGKL